MGCLFVLNSKGIFQMSPKTFKKLDKIVLPKTLKKLYGAKFFSSPIYMFIPKSCKYSFIK